MIQRYSLDVVVDVVIVVVVVVVVVVVIGVQPYLTHCLMWIRSG
jgi:hypothetical protein